MAWTTPASWSVGELVNASKMNTHLKANLEYLKGAASIISFDNGGVFAGTIKATAQTAPSSGSGPELFHLSGTSYLLAYNRTGSAYLPLELAASAHTLSISGTAAVTVDANRNTGFGTTSPQGRVHGYNTVGGFLHWVYDGVDTTARTVIPDGTGDVLYHLYALYQVRASDGSLDYGNTNGFALTPGGPTKDIYNVVTPGNSCTLRVNANGSVDVRRTGGSLTFKVNLWLIWL